MQSRFVQLEDMFDIKNMMAENDDYSQCANVDYKKTHIKMEKERNRFVEFLRENLQ